MNLYYFNPTCEMAIANNTPSYMIPQSFCQFEEALEFLPLVFTQPSDALLIKNKPSETFQAHTKQWMGYAPQYVTLAELLENRTPIDEVRPWGWSPACVHYLKPLALQCKHKIAWNTPWRQLSSRAFALTLLEALQTKYPNDDILPQSINPVACYSIAEIQQQIEKRGAIVLKSPWSSAGRGVQMLRKPGLNESNKRWITSILETQGLVMVESLLHKETDFSFHFYIDKQGIVIPQGISYFSTNLNGQYAESNLNAQKETPQMLLLQNQLMDILQNSTYTKHYSGYLGIDALTYTNSGGELRIHPVVEINMRYSMGLLSLVLEQKMHKQSHGTWKIIKYKNTAERKTAINELRRKNSLTLQNNCIVKGLLELCDPEADGHYAAFALITH